MNPVAIIITLFLSIDIVGLIIGLSYWGITRHKEDQIWRVIFSFLGLLIFGSIFWISYWIGVNGAFWLGWIAAPVVYAWMYTVFSKRTPATLDRIVFAFFGLLLFVNVFAGGASAGSHGWWGMSIPFLLAAFVVPFALIKP